MTLPLEPRKPIDTLMISAVWLNMGEVTHYAVQEFLRPGFGPAEKKTLDEVSNLIESGMKIYTGHWDYQLAKFKGHSLVKLRKWESGKYLYIDPDDRRMRNLRHLVNLSWYNL